MSMNNDRVYPRRPRRSPPSTPRWTPASPSSTPPTSTRRSWDTMGHNEELIGKAIRATAAIPMKRGDRHQGRHHPQRGRELGPRRVAGLSAIRGGEVAAQPRRRRRSTSTSGTGPTARMVYGDAIGHFKTLQDEGKIKAIGISNANVEEIEIALDVLGEGGLASVQNEFSPRFRCSTDTLECAASRARVPALEPARWHRRRWSRGRRRFAAFGEIAAAHGVSPQQVVLAWELSLGDHVIPIPGARRPASITDSAKATRPGAQRRGARALLGARPAAEPMRRARRSRRGDHRRRPQRPGRRRLPGPGRTAA